MKLTMKKFDICPEGIYPATCVMIADIGLHKRYDSDDEYIPMMRFDWEIEVDEKIFRVHRTYNKNLDERSNLCRDIESMLERSLTNEEVFETGIDLKQFITDNNCHKLEIYHKISTLSKRQKTYAAIKAVWALGKMEPPPPTSTIPVIYDIQDPNQSNFNMLPKNVRKIIRESYKFGEY